jgi:DNA-binding transcriptional LysR family regulator
VREATRASVAGGAPTVGNGVATAGSGVAVMIRSMIHGVCVAAARAGVGVAFAPHALVAIAIKPIAIIQIELVIFTTSS